MDDKYNISKPRKPETKSERLQQQIEDLVKRRDAELDPVTKKALNAQITKLFAEYERAKL